MYMYIDNIIVLQIYYFNKFFKISFIRFFFVCRINLGNDNILNEFNESVVVLNLDDIKC